MTAELPPCWHGTNCLKRILYRAIHSLSGDTAFVAGTVRQSLTCALEEPYLVCFVSPIASADLAPPRACVAAHADVAQQACLLGTGSLIGAGGVTAYNTYHSNDWGIVKTLQWWIEKGQADTARANNPELARLEDMV